MGLTRGRWRRVFFISIPALVVASLVMAVLVEGWVRLTWNPKKGTPGFYRSDPLLGVRLGENYDGWYAGVPVKTNAQGFRAARDFDLRKSPKTFRILVLGDSVTFGHGAVHDYPSLLQKLLDERHPGVDWQVWNLGVPGYNTSQEYSQLMELGPAFQPDLVIVGFFINDIVANEPPRSPGLVRRATVNSFSFLQRHWYSFELYKRITYTIAWQLSGTEASRLRFEHMESEEQATIPLETLAESRQQALTPFDLFSDAEVATRPCPQGRKPIPADVTELESRPDWPQFVDAVRRFQTLNREGKYKIVFFLNVIPPVCPDGDYFYDGRSFEHPSLFKLFNDGTPTVSAYPVFLRARPSQMPLAEGHAVGNANALKAETLFEFLTSQSLVPQN